MLTSAQKFNLSIRGIAWSLICGAVFPIGLIAGLASVVFGILHIPTVFTWQEGWQEGFCGPYWCGGSHEPAPSGFFVNAQVGAITLAAGGLIYLSLMTFALFKGIDQDELRTHFPQWWRILLVAGATIIFFTLMSDAYQKLWTITEW